MKDTVTLKREIEIETDIKVYSVVDQNGFELDIKEVTIDRDGDLTVKVHVDYPEEEE